MKRAVWLSIFGLVIGISMSAEAYDWDFDPFIPIPGWDEFEPDPIKSDPLADIQLEKTIKIEDYGWLTPVSFEYADAVYSYINGRNDCEQGEYDMISSGDGADFAVLRIDMTNTDMKSRESHDYPANCEVKVIYDDEYEFQGWVRQYNYDNGTSPEEPFAGEQNTNFFIDPEDHFAVGLLDTAHLLIGCTLPEYVIKGNEPLEMIFTMEGYEFTYHIRK